MPELIPEADELPEPVVPAPPAVEPLLVLPALPAAPELDELPEPEPLDIEAFVRMNDAPLPLPDAERDALVPEVAPPPVDPVVPVAPLASPDCRQPVTVMVPLCPDRFAPLCDDVWLLPLCAATIAVHPNPIANIHAARFIKRLL